MGFSFRKSFRILPGVHINLSKSGPSLSIGLPGASVSVNTRGEMRFYGGAGLLHYRRSMTMGAAQRSVMRQGAVASLHKVFSRSNQ